SHQPDAEDEGSFPSRAQPNGGYPQSDLTAAAEILSRPKRILLGGRASALTMRAKSPSSAFATPLVVPRIPAHPGQGMRQHEVGRLAPASFPAHVPAKWLPVRRQGRRSITSRSCRDSNGTGRAWSKRSLSIANHKRTSQYPRAIDHGAPIVKIT